MKPQAELTRTLTVATLLVAGLSGALGIAHADVPTAGDIAACNQEAREGARGRAVSPTAKDEVDANAARNVRTAAVAPPGAAGPATQSPDPQIHGMDGDGAKDAAYRAVYRVCMRRNGF
jgi:hypothetical protein